MKQIKKIIIAIIIIVCTFFFIDFVFGIIVNDWFSKKIKTHFSYGMYMKENPQLVFFGSSRAENHYDTPFIRDSLNISTFNLGEAGRGITYHDAAIRSYLIDHSPETIVLDLMPDDLTGQINNRIKPLYPFMNKYPVIKEVAVKVDPLNKYLLHSNLLKYNSEFFDYIKKYRHPFNPQNLGFVPLKIRNTYKDTKEMEFVPPTYDVDIVAKNCLLDIIDRCKENNINLIIAYSPELYIRNYKLPITSICDSLGITVLDFRDFRSPNSSDEYFYDNYHLNKCGAREYTRCFMDSLKIKCNVE